MATGPGVGTPTPRLYSIAGDIARRILSYLPDFYKDDPIYESLVEFLAITAPELDYYLERSQSLPTLVDLTRVSDRLADTTGAHGSQTFLSLLGRLLGYEWEFEGLDTGLQRRLLEDLVEFYKTRGTLPSILRVAKYGGARHPQIFSPYEFTFVLDSSALSGTDHLTDNYYWRWGTYEIISDADLSGVRAKLDDVHPAGTVRFTSWETEIGFLPALPTEEEVEFEIETITLESRTVSDTIVLPDSLTYTVREIIHELVTHTDGVVMNDPTPGIIQDTSTYQIQGTVKNQAGTINLAAARVEVKKDAVIVKTVYTAANGFFSASTLFPDTYTLTVTKTGYQFADPATTVTIGPSSVGNIILATGEAIYRIAGDVHNSSSLPIGGARLDLKQDDVLVKTVYTSAGGGFSFLTLFPGTYTITATAVGYSFDDPAKTITIGPNSFGNHINAT